MSKPVLGSCNSDEYPVPRLPGLAESRKDFSRSSPSSSGSVRMVEGVLLRCKRWSSGVPSLAVGVEGGRVSGEPTELPGRDEALQEAKGN